MLPLQTSNSGACVLQIIWPPSDHLSKSPWIPGRRCIYHAFSVASSLLKFTIHREELLDVRPGSGPKSGALMQQY